MLDAVGERCATRSRLQPHARRVALLELARRARAPAARRGRAGARRRARSRGRGLRDELREQRALLRRQRRALPARRRAPASVSAITRARLDAAARRQRGAHDLAGRRLVVVRDPHAQLDELGRQRRLVVEHLAEVDRLDALGRRACRSRTTTPVTLRAPNRTSTRAPTCARAREPRRHAVVIPPRHRQRHRDLDEVGRSRVGHDRSVSAARDTARSPHRAARGASARTRGSRAGSRACRRRRGACPSTTTPYSPSATPRARAARRSAGSRRPRPAWSPRGAARSSAAARSARRSPSRLGAVPGLRLLDHVADAHVARCASRSPATMPYMCSWPAGTSMIAIAPAPVAAWTRIELRRCRGRRRRRSDRRRAAPRTARRRPPRARTARRGRARAAASGAPRSGGPSSTSRAIASASSWLPRSRSVCSSSYA